jgi:hypothetical protein
VVRFWCAVGYNYKSDLHVYRVLATNEKRGTINYNLRNIFKGWMDNNEDFILEENRDSTHISKASRLYKDRPNIDYYFMPEGSLDRIVIDIVASMFMAKLRKQLSITNAECIDAAVSA